MSAWDVVVSQFGNPRGPLGVVAGWIMQLRPSNRERTLRTVELLALRPGERVLELGFGPGLGIARAAERVSPGRVVGLERSELMLRKASWINRAAIARGEVRLELGDAEALPGFEAPFDAIFAVNVQMFWRDPEAVLAGLRACLRPGGRIALTHQPRAPRSTDADAASSGQRTVALLEAAGFEEIRVEHLPMEPVAAVCVLARRPAITA